MASPAHCFYCFECLKASFDHRDPPTLESVLDAYVKYKADDKGSLNKDDTAVDSAADEEEEEEQSVEQAGEDERPSQQMTSKTGLQIPSISRLQASTPSSRSSSAASPSGFSQSSSSSQLTTPSSLASTPSQPSYASALSVTDSFPLFVTWNTISRSGNKSLRGCIGTFEGLPLTLGLSTYALTSAFDDTRFSPIPASLLPALSCSLTLLADFEPCRDAMDWTLGTHGLRISFTYRNRRHGATYLPDVAVEQGWDKEETVESLMRKAGWDGGYGHGVARRLLRASARGADQPSTKPWNDVQDFHAIRYTGLRSSASYDEWRRWRDWLDKNGEVLR